MAKATNLLSQDGSRPRFFIRALVHLEDAVKASAETDKKKMNASNAKASNILKQKLKKYVKTVEADMESYRQNPVESEEEVVESVKEAPVAAPVPAAKAEQKKAPANRFIAPTTKSDESGDDGESTDSYFKSDSEESESDSESELSDRPKGRAKW